VPDRIFHNLFAIQRNIGVQGSTESVFIEDASTRFGGLPPSVQQLAFKAKSEDSQIVEPHDVIGVGVSKHSCTNHPGVAAQQLQPEFRSGIDNELTQRCPHQHSGTQSMISGLLRCANSALAADDGHADTRSRAHQDQMERIRMG
jgi:hypothetical protein